MAVEPAGCLNLAQKNLRDLLAGSAAVRTWLGVSTEVQAKARIHYTVLPTPHTATFPLIVITLQGPWRLEGFAQGSGTSFGLGDAIGVELSDDYDPLLDDRDNITTFENAVSGAVLGISQALGQRGNLASDSIQGNHDVLSHPDEYADGKRLLNMQMVFEYSGSPLQ